MTKQNPKMEKALQDIADCFDPKNKSKQELATDFLRSVTMLCARFDKYLPDEKEIADKIRAALVLHKDMQKALDSESLSDGYRLAYRGVQQSLEKAFNKISDFTYVELRDREGGELYKGVQYTARQLTAHVKDPSLRPAPRQKSLFIRL